MLKQLWRIREAVRESKPFIYCRTGGAAAGLAGNALLAAGAVPLFSEAAAETDELIKRAGGVAISADTPHARQMSGLLQVGELAAKYCKPVVFNPEGAGWTAYRVMCANQLLTDIKIALLVGRSFDIGRLAVNGEAGLVPEMAALKAFAGQKKIPVCWGGPESGLTDGEVAYRLVLPVDWLELTVGGYAALCFFAAACVAVAARPAEGGLAALAVFNAAVVKARAGCKGPGSFAGRLVDALANLSYKEFKKIAGEGLMAVAGAEMPTFDESPVESQE